MTTYTARRRAADQVLEKRSSGFLLVRSDDDRAWKWRSKLRLSLRDADKARNFWDVELAIYDCETKERIYHFRALGS